MQEGMNPLRKSVTLAVLEAVVILAKFFVNMLTVHRHNTDENGRIMIYKGGKGIYVLYKPHYNDTCKEAI